jgi:hypothetical protein
MGGGGGGGGGGGRDNRDYNNFSVRPPDGFRPPGMRGAEHERLVDYAGLDWG